MKGDEVLGWNGTVSFKLLETKENMVISESAFTVPPTCFPLKSVDHATNALNNIMYTYAFI